MLFKVCKEENQPSRLVYEVPSHTMFIKKVETPFPFPKLVQMSIEDVHTTISVLGLTKRNRSQWIHTHTKQLRISEHCLSQIDNCNYQKRNCLLVIQFKNTNQILGIRIQEMTNRQENRKKEKISQNRKIHEGSRLRAVLLSVGMPECIVKTFHTKQIMRGRWNVTAWGKCRRFWCFVAQEN